MLEYRNEFKKHPLPRFTFMSLGEIKSGSYRSKLIKNSPCFNGWEDSTVLYLFFRKLKS